MKTKFTKGEWKVNHKLSVQVEPENPIRTLTICQVYGGDEESKANAKLIETSPKLLQSCIDLANEFRHQLIKHATDLDMDEKTAIAYAESFEIWKEAQKVIKKATE